MHNPNLKHKYKSIELHDIELSYWYIDTLLTKYPKYLNSGLKRLNMTQKWCAYFSIRTSFFL